MKRLQEVLRDASVEKHERSCAAHHALCTCEHDDKLYRLLRQAANRIEDLENAKGA